MATHKERYEIIGRAVADPDFRARLMESVEGAVSQAGFQLTAEQLARLKEIDLSDLDRRLGIELAQQIGCYLINHDVEY